MKPINPLPILFAIIAALIILLMWVAFARAAHCPRGQWYRVHLNLCVPMSERYGAKRLPRAHVQLTQAQTSAPTPPIVKEPDWLTTPLTPIWRPLTDAEARTLSDDEAHNYGIQLLKHDPEAMRILRESR